MDGQNGETISVPVAPSGAVFTHQYYERTQEAFIVTRNDLEDLMEGDSLGSWSITGGVALLAATIPLGIEHYMTQEGAFKMSNLLWFCVLGAVVGGIFLLIGIVTHRKKTRRLNRIYSELRPIGPKTVTAQPTGGTFTAS